MDIRRAILVRNQYDSLPTEAKQYVDALVKQNPKLDYLELFYKAAIKDNLMDCLFVNYNWSQSITRKLAFWLLLVFCKTDVFIPEQLKTYANLFMKAIVIASNFVVEGDYKEIYGTYHSWPYNPNTTEE